MAVTRAGARLRTTAGWEPPNHRPTPAVELLTVREVLQYATINGAKHLGLDGRTGTLPPGKQADIATSPRSTWPRSTMCPGRSSR
ncbi:putative amidohydrolase YtcJ [Thermocatellispora tengchongensis]|uniref:Putative amidohydrolase YtcJ n=1 Tax=Thermocatellispora tengchongensis TaxID=1073253 RepID=A0A840PHM9_9ACTN|nr:amidohydrolase family protein [Thermocatellispora tengchongensis]MBB5137413.1 putative amidohydrolase YtcJ [Thermocatellispora tengchongensis]